MAKDDWFRNETWNDAIEAEFQQKLKRARDKSQYLRIQASYLAGTFPEVALRLLDQYFLLGDHFDMAQAYVDKARALLSLDNVEEALVSYEAALAREQAYPNLKTGAYLDYVSLILAEKRVSLYPAALDVLNRNNDRLIFPIDRFRANGARALILQQMGASTEARDAARLAVAATAETKSGFRFHPKIGLVKDRDSDFARQIAALAK